MYSVYYFVFSSDVLHVHVHVYTCTCTCVYMYMYMYVHIHYTCTRIICEAGHPGVLCLHCWFGCGVLGLGFLSLQLI